MKQSDLFEDESFEITKPLSREELEIALAVIIKTKSSKINDKLKAIETVCKMNGYFVEKKEIKHSGQIDPSTRTLDDYYKDAT